MFFSSTILENSNLTLSCPESVLENLSYIYPENSFSVIPNHVSSCNIQSVESSTKVLNVPEKMVKKNPVENNNGEPFQFTPNHVLSCNIQSVESSTKVQNVPEKMVKENPVENNNEEPFQLTNEKAIGESESDVDKENKPPSLLTKRGTPRKRKLKESNEQLDKNKRSNKLVKLHLKPPCSEECIKKCGKNFDTERRIELNEEFKQMPWMEQRRFILANTEETLVKRRTVNDGTSKRNKSYLYFFGDKEGKKLQVCKTFFLTTLGFNRKNDKMVLNVLRNSENHLTPKPDQRGRTECKHKKNMYKIKQHIQSFNPTISHYRREHAPDKKYLPSDITIKKMYDDFMEKYKGSIDGCSYEKYRQVLKLMNISFTKLGHEECECCTIFDNHPHDKDNYVDDCDLCAKHKKHLIKVINSRAAYRTDGQQERDPSQSRVFSADLQKVIMLPRLDQFKLVVFTCRLVVFNETFVPVGKLQKDLQPEAVVWHEGTAGRKKEDIVSSFHKFFSSNRDISILTIWLDNCSGQNKNWCLFSYLVYLVNSDLVSTNSIVLKYFEPGHTFMSADSFHHQVEMSMKNKKIYDFNDFLDAVQRSNSGKVKVHSMNETDFADWIDGFSQQKLKKLKARPHLSDMVKVEFSRNSFKLKYWTDLETNEGVELDFLKTNIIKKGFPNSHFRNTPRGVSLTKKEDIVKKLCPLMPENRQIFWKNLTTNENSNDLSISFE